MKHAEPVVKPGHKHYIQYEREGESASQRDIDIIFSHPCAQLCVLVCSELNLRS